MNYLIQQLSTNEFYLVPIDKLPITVNKPVIDNTKLDAWLSEHEEYILGGSNKKYINYNKKRFEIEEFTCKFFVLLDEYEDEDDDDE